jgi:Protein of unknown function (DUF3311)
MRHWHPAHLLLILPFIAVLWVPFYNRTQPTLWSVPFYYWYQMLWILLGAAVIGLVYLLEHGTEH